METRKKIRPKASGIKSFLNRALSPTMRRIQMPRLPAKIPQEPSDLPLSANARASDQKMKPPSSRTSGWTKFSFILILGIFSHLLGLFTVFRFLGALGLLRVLNRELTYHHNLIPNPIRESTLFFWWFHLLNRGPRFLRQRSLPMGDQPWSSTVRRSMLSVVSGPDIPNPF